MRVRCDPRDLKVGSVVSDLGGYYDSQNIIALYDQSLKKEVFSCVLHHSFNREGGQGLCLSHCRSEDGGRTWSELVPVEDPTQQSHDGYQCLVGDRIYLFYGWNEGAHPPPLKVVEETVCEKSGRRKSVERQIEQEKYPRTDMQLDDGFWCKWSDDFGVSFSKKRILIPVRRSVIDALNPWDGRTMGAFCCDKPSVIDGAIFFAFQKTRDGNGESYGSEVFIMRSKDFITRHWESVSSFGGKRKNETEVVGWLNQARWETLPKDSEHGLQTRRGLLLGEEPHVLHVMGERILCIWRNELGFLDSCHSDDRGETWDSGDEPKPLLYGSAFGNEAVLSSFAEEIPSYTSELNDSLRLENSPRKTLLKEHGSPSSSAGTAPPAPSEVELLPTSGPEVGGASATKRLLQGASRGEPVKLAGAQTTVGDPETHTTSESVHDDTPSEIIQKGAASNAFVRNAELYLRSDEYRRLVLENPLVIRNPRGAITPFLMRDGYYALLFYNNGHTERLGYCGRLLHWLVVGKVTTAPRTKKPEIYWSQPDVCLYWDGSKLDDREEWNEDWAIVDGPGYADFQQSHHSGDLVLVESNKLTVRFHRVPKEMLECMKEALEIEHSFEHLSSPDQRFGSSLTTMPVHLAGLAATVSEHRVVVWPPMGSSRVAVEASMTVSPSGKNLTVTAPQNFVVALRAPVLADLRTGGGFSFSLWISRNLVRSRLDGSKSLDKLGSLAALGLAHSDSASPSRRVTEQLSKHTREVERKNKHPFFFNHRDETAILLVDGMTEVSAALDDEAEEYIWKGYYISASRSHSHSLGKENSTQKVTFADSLAKHTETTVSHISVTIFVSDGFSNHISYEVKVAEDENTRNSDLSFLSFAFDGGPKIVTCVVDGRLHNEAPQGWQWFPRALGEIGGCNVRVHTRSGIQSYEVYDRALLVAERVSFFYSTNPAISDVSVVQKRASRL